MNENISPANIGGMGNPAFPQGGEVGSGDVPAGKGDAKKEQKKKKKEREEYLKNRKEETMLHTTFSGFLNEEYQAVGRYNTVKKVIKELGRRPSEQELATFITKNYRDVTGVERGDGDPAANDKIADLVSFYKFDIDDWQIAWFDAQNESVDEAKIKDARKSLGYVAFLKEMSESVDMYYLDNAKDSLQPKNVYQHLGVEYGQTRRGDKYVQINYIPVSRPQSQQPEWVKVFYDNDKDLNKIGKELDMDLKESVDEAKIKDARKSLGYVAYLKEMSDLNAKDRQRAYQSAVTVLMDKGMTEKQAIGFLNSPHGKYMGEYLVPGMDYSHEAFLDKLDEYYNERMLKKYAKDYANLGESLKEGFFSRLRGKESKKEEKEVEDIINQFQELDVQGAFDKAIDNLDHLDKVMAAMDEADPTDVDDAFAKYRKKTQKYKKLMKVLKSSNKELEKRYGKDAFDDLGLKSKNMMDQFRAQANSIAKDQR